jgi:2-polyprenyl-6-methoxyphenol hydroxylase-like FAD-dependent oxidoreductase
MTRDGATGARNSGATRKTPEETDMTHPHPTRPRRAAVIGGSMAGLLAARVLAEHYDEVVVLERDVLPEGAQLRKGTPHAAHPHGLLARGREVIESLFPGFTASLNAQGALSADLGNTISFQADGRSFARKPVGHLGIGASRLAIEAELRRRVRRVNGVRFIDGVDVTGMRHESGRVTGLGWRLAGSGADAESEHLAADLVVDCSGRASRTPGWLRERGYEAPEEERVQVGIAYVSAYFERDAAIVPQTAAAICTVTPARPRPGVLIAQEPDEQGRARWVVGVGGYQGDHPQQTRQGMLERARAIGNADIIGLAESGNLLGPVMRYHFPFSLRRRYERLRRFPEGLLVMGDAMTSFNPIYGQGMTVAACEALALREALAQAPAQRARRFFKLAAKVVDIPWQLAVGGDLSLPIVPGPRPLPVRIINAYIARLYRAAPRDAEVAAAFLKVVHLVAGPPSLFKPGIVWRVWRHGGAAASPAGADHVAGRPAHA